MPKAEGEKAPQREIDLADNLINKSWLKSLSGNSIRTNTGKTFVAMVDQKVNGERWQSSRQPLSAGGESSISWPH